ncbi:MAG: hypothetical protein IID61_06190 [SAR324 cluster bacterium]|nr:hypothetical protein [SAR324 cluster bacterium]
MDYLDRRGRNLVRAWLMEELSEAGRFKLEQRMKTMAAIERTEWPPWASPLVGFKGILELKLKHERVQYRPLFCYGPNQRQLTFLFGAKEIGDAFSPGDAPHRALTRKSEIERNREQVERHAFHDDETN